MMPKKIFGASSGFKPLAIVRGMVIIVAIICLLVSCGGGFNGDSEGADILAPKIFGPDTTK